MNTAILINPRLNRNHLAHAPARIPAPADVFRLRTAARAILWQCCEFDLHEAVDVLRAAAETSGLVDAIGQDAVQAIMAEAFGAVR